MRVDPSAEQGFDQVLIDYVHPRKYPVAGPFAIWALRAATAGVLVGLYQFNTHDIGMYSSPVLDWG
jgi:succinate dehydrogenase (ubiquinone) membrane anchor subunit